MREQEIRAKALLVAATVSANYPVPREKLFAMADEFAKYIKGEQW